MSTTYQTYSNTQNYYPQNTGYPCAQGMPQMVPMGSPMFNYQPMPMTAPMPPVILPPVAQMNCGFQTMNLAQGTLQAAPQLLPSMLSSPASFHTMESVPSDFSTHNSTGFEPQIQGMVKVTSMDSYPSMQRSPSPGMGMIPSYSPQPYPMLPPMISLIPASPSPLPGLQVPTPPLANSVTVTNFDTASMSTGSPVNVTEPILDTNHLGFRGNSVPRSRSPTRSMSRARSCSDYSVTSEPQFERTSSDSEPSKRELVNKAFAKLQAMFGPNFDQNGNRGENILRLKVKTRTALEQIVPFVEFCQRENLIVSVSCPISTKKGRQQVRGFLAYLQTRNEGDADRVEELIQQYNASNNSPFNTWHRNPPSTWKNQA